MNRIFFSDLLSLIALQNTQIAFQSYHNRIYFRYKLLIKSPYDSQFPVNNLSDCTDSPMFQKSYFIYIKHGATKFIFDHAEVCKEACLSNKSALSDWLTYKKVCWVAMRHTYWRFSYSVLLLHARMTRLHNRWLQDIAIFMFKANFKLLLINIVDIFCNLPFTYKLEEFGLFYV